MTPTYPTYTIHKFKGYLRSFNKLDYKMIDVTFNEIFSLNDLFDMYFDICYNLVKFNKVVLKFPTNDYKQYTLSQNYDEHIFILHTLLINCFNNNKLIDNTIELSFNNTQFDNYYNSLSTSNEHSHKLLRCIKNILKLKFNESICTKLLTCSLQQAVIILYINQVYFTPSHSYNNLILQDIT